MRINEMTSQVTLSQPTYNPETAAFEAQAKLFEAGAVFTYRVTHTAAPHADFEAITRGLRSKALVQHQRAKERTHRLIQDTVRAATSRANSPTFGAYLAA